MLIPPMVLTAGSGDLLCCCQHNEVQSNDWCMLCNKHYQSTQGKKHLIDHLGGENYIICTQTLLHSAQHNVKTYLQDFQNKSTPVLPRFLSPLIYLLYRGQAYRETC